MVLVITVINVSSPIYKETLTLFTPFLSKRGN